MVISNQYLRVSFQTQGAEITGITDLITGEEYLFNDQQVWSYQAPILFPKVSNFYHQQYLHQGQGYHMAKHGFARQMPFYIQEHRDDCVVLVLEDNVKTREQYPWSFRFSVTYVLVERELTITFKVEHLGEGVLPWQLGYHPAFPVSLGMEHYQLIFQQPSLTIIDLQGEETATTQQVWKLSEIPFAQIDTLIVKGVKGNEVCLRNPRSVLVFKGDFPYLALWNRDSLISVEFWEGLPDFSNQVQEITEAEDFVQTIGSAQRQLTIGFYPQEEYESRY